MYRFVFSLTLHQLKYICLLNSYLYPYGFLLNNGLVFKNPFDEFIDAVHLLLPFFSFYCLPIIVGIQDALTSQLLMQWQPVESYIYRNWKTLYLAHRFTFRFAGGLLPGLATACEPGLFPIQRASSWSVNSFAVPCLRVPNSHIFWYKISDPAPKTHPREIICTTLL